MALKKVTDSDLLSKGVTYLADRPRLGSTATLKRKFEEILRDVMIPTFNQNVDEQSPLNALVPVTYENSSKALEASSSAYDYAKKAFEAVLDGGDALVQNPVQGTLTSVGQALWDVFLCFSPGPILPEDFDARRIVPEVFDAKSIDPLVFDTNAKTILT